MGGKKTDVQSVYALLGSKWTVPVISTLQQETLRYGTIKKALPNITQRVLTMTPQKLERNGMVERHVYPTALPQTEYKLTPLGLELLKLCGILSDWAGKHQEDITRAQQAYNRRMKRHLLYLGYGIQENP